MQFQLIKGLKKLLCKHCNIVTLDGPTIKQSVRALIDSGSGRSYISSHAVKNFGFNSVGSIEIAHCLFGGTITNFKKHAIYKVDVENINSTFKKQYQLVEVEKICGPICPTPQGPWTEQLTAKGIQLSDCNKHQYDIHVLFGVDTSSKLYTGKIFETKSGPVAFETRFGWTMMQR